MKAAVDGDKQRDRPALRTRLHANGFRDTLHMLADGNPEAHAKFLIDPKSDGTVANKST